MSEADVYTAREIGDLRMQVSALAQEGFRIISVIYAQNDVYYIVAQKDDRSALSQSSDGSKSMIAQDLPDWAKWPSSMPPAYWMAVNPKTGQRVKVYRSYEDYCYE